MWMDRGGSQHFAGRIDDGNLDAGAVGGIKPHGDTRSGWCREQQVAQVRGEHAHGFRLCRRP